MTTTGSVDIVRRLYRHLAERNLNAFAALLHPDVVWDTPDAVPWARDVAGVDAVRAYVTDFWGFFEDYRIEADRFAGSGDDVVVIGHHVGARGRVGFAHFVELADGLVVRWREQLDSATIIRVIAAELVDDRGLSPRD
jgi:ketosteroid isomerase-like protein